MCRDSVNFRRKSSVVYLRRIDQSGKLAKQSNIPSPCWKLFHVPKWRAVYLEHPFSTRTAHPSKIYGIRHGIRLRSRQHKNIIWLHFEHVGVPFTIFRPELECFVLLERRDLFRNLFFTTRPMEVWMLSLHLMALLFVLDLWLSWPYGMLMVRSIENTRS